MPKENECYRLAGSVNQGGGPGCLGQKDSTLRIQAHVAADESGEEWAGRAVLSSLSRASPAGGHSVFSLLERQIGSRHSIAVTLT